MLIWTSRNIPNVGLFSAYAEVFRTVQAYLRSDLTFLCLRRGVSIIILSLVALCHFSLPTQRCFSTHHRAGPTSALFSAYAEVFLASDLFGSKRRSFLCLRRGVSTRALSWSPCTGFSLPTQRCFRDAALARAASLLFSAYAEVFPIYGGILSTVAAFLCLRRGVSDVQKQYAGLTAFSLPTQRCFRPESYRSST